MPIKLKALLATTPAGQEVTVKGWVRTFRANRFIALNDGSTLGNLNVWWTLKILTKTF